jgi:hypothetical protein
MPLLKKKGFDRDNAANYRPISNLHTVSKIAENCFMPRVIAHIERSPCFNQLKSAYRRSHSTETTLFKLANDIHCAADDKARTLLVPLDLSASIEPSTRTPCLND